MWKRAVVEEKKKSWIKIASTFNDKTPKATTYENLRKIKGFEKRKINVLKEHKRYTTHSEMANKLRKTFSDI